jgi:transketolase
VQQVDADDHLGLRRALIAAREDGQHPSLVMVHSVIGRGSPNRAGKSKAHGEAFGAEEARLTKQACGWPLEPEFLIPDDVRGYFAQRIREKRAARSQADARLAGWREGSPDQAAAWDAARARRLPGDLERTLCAGLAGKEDATRKHGAVVLERLAAAAPYYVGGSADLAGSAAPPILKGRGIVGPGAAPGEDPFAGSNLHFGVREHAMGAITNGVALDGTFRPYCGTFLIFSDYMRPAIRLSALMGIPSIFVFTHDSIFLGEDGPTHQPVEHLDSLRAIPNLTVWRPADGVETAMAWAWIARHASGPAMLALSRQTVPALVREAPFQPGDVLRGAYCVQDPGGAPQVVLVATGSEVSLACAAAGKLRAEGTSARVVSMPCVSLFLEQPAEQQRRLIPDDETLVVAIEAARGESLRRFVGRHGLICGIDRFGASAPYPALAEAFGFTPDAIAARVRARLATGRSA